MVLNLGRDLNDVLDKEGSLISDYLRYPDMKNSQQRSEGCSVLSYEHSPYED